MTTNTLLKQKISAIISEKHLLKHPFYIAWTEGKLTKEQLRHYAEQYFYNVLAEPTYLSAVHFNTPHIHSETNSGDISVRQEVLRNLIDEEHGEKNHPALWKNFAFALGANDKILANTAALPTTENLVNTFRDICLNRPFYAGLAALHAFESQVPDIAAVTRRWLWRLVRLLLGIETSSQKCAGESPETLGLPLQPSCRHHTHAAFRH